MYNSWSNCVTGETAGNQIWGKGSGERQTNSNQGADIHGKKQAARSTGQGMGCHKTRVTAKKACSKLFWTHA